MSQQRLAEGWQALASADWAAAKQAFEDARASGPSPEALDGLGRSLWWLKDVRAAIEARTQAYRGYKMANRLIDAAGIAIWLARELRTLFRNDAAADGWLARAETLLADVGGSSLTGWVLVARAEASFDPAEGARLCRRALGIAREHNDPDLEVVSLSRLGLLEVATGQVDPGVSHLDEAMAAASAGEAMDLQTVGDAYCALMEAADMLGDVDRLAQWSAAVAELRPRDGFGPLDDLGSSTAYGNLSSFCGACCGGMFLVTGRLDEAEDELMTAIAELEAGGMESRCVHPVTQLAELRVLQGRLEEAQVLLRRFEDLPESVRPLAVLDLSLGAPDEAAARLQRRLDELRDLKVGALPLWTVMVDAQLARSDVGAAAEAVQRIEEIAALTGSKRHLAETLFARGKLAAARSRRGAPEDLRKAARMFSEAGMALQACRARMALARASAGTDKPLAISEARSALAAFDRLGAGPDADAAASFLRGLGVKGRTGPKNLELLSKRELEVLRLVAEGLSNAEVAERLFISVKTAGHHVSNILSKLSLRSRTEAAAYAAIHLGREPASR